ncbi:RagB/SusD family nutrient uptake outer membrane protein [Chitinophaga lutea]|uniref:RagB/SusD family nutrient uptake outer membrane protein n=1 Tax=Chitinophaga lutea TaxID=2488634 RepID=A0A3N4PUT6_9BACT|nr:RagB/SusD family nutrient uptake outer membrane protein [Chitinophaga lutea]RPE12543.1 RagB/SusD family nutrient uptake outer membrane protein [Chitinophaga lutea]
MKAKAYVYWAALLLTTGITSSCKKDYLERKPLTQVSNDEYWKTADDLDKYVLQFYTTFPVIESVGSYTGLTSWDAVRGADTQISGTASTMWNGARAPVTSGGNWTWTDIRNVNTFFENYRKCKDPFERYQQYVGEAHFFKAKLYFDKVLAYGDVPWYDKPLGMDSDELYKARDVRTAVVDSILSNLDQAIVYLASLKTLPGGSNRLSKEAALLFKSRVALFEGSWQKYHKGTEFATPGADHDKYFRIARQAAEELMKPAYKTGIYTSAGPGEDYNRMFSLTDQGGNPEVLLWKKFDRTLNMGHSYQIYVSDRTAGIAVTMGQVEHYLDKNGAPYDYMTLSKTVKGSKFLARIAQDCDPRLSQLIWIPNMVMWDNSYGKGVFSKPFLDKSGEYLNNTGFQIRKGNDPKDPQAGSGVAWNTNSITASIVFRYAEVLLNYAEATAELGEAVDYNRSINLLRRRSGMPDFRVNPDPYRSRYADYGYPLSDELHEIRRERTVELAAEGFRYDDLRRWAAHKLMAGKRPKGYPLDLTEWTGQKINYQVDADGLIDPFVKQLPTGYRFNARRDYLECIPTNEITLNKNLKQNPGW